MSAQCALASQMRLTDDILGLIEVLDSHFVFIDQGRLHQWIGTIAQGTVGLESSHMKMPSIMSWCTPK